MNIAKTTLTSIIFLSLLFGCARPIAEFTLPASDTIAPVEIQFNNNSKKSETYFWDFGDGNTSTEESPSHTYSSSGNYLIVLKAEKGNKSSTAEQRIQVKAPKNCLVELSTSYGKMVIELYNNTPLHRDNFIKLVEEGFYNDLLFHRVINGFMIQGGDPRSKNAKAGDALGNGGPGYQVNAEIKNFHIKGALAAARTSDSVNPMKKSSGSQFYIVQGQKQTDASLMNMEMSKGISYSPEIKKAYVENGGTPQLDAEYTVFGQVIKGMDVIDKIAATKTKRGDRPQEDVKMTLKVIN